MWLVVLLIQLSLSLAEMPLLANADGLWSIATLSNIDSSEMLFAEAGSVQPTFAQAKTIETLNTFTPDTLSIACETERTVFNHGEELKYIAYYKLGFIWFRIGEVTFSVEVNEYSYILTAKGFSYPKYAWLFPVNDYYKTVLSKETLKPMSSIRDLNEGNYKLYEYVEYDWVGNRAIVTRGKTKEATTTKVKDIQSCARDLLSLPYYLRVQDYTGLSMGDVIPFHIFLNQKNYALALQYENNELMEVKQYGSLHTQRYSAHTIAGNTFGDNGSVMNAYISDDANKIPVYVESDVYVGSVKLILEGASNLKYPLNYKGSGK